MSSLESIDTYRCYQYNRSLYFITSSDVSGWYDGFLIIYLTVISLYPLLTKCLIVTSDLLSSSKVNSINAPFIHQTGCISYHCYTDYFQLYVFVKPGELSNLSIFDNCLEDISGLISLSFLLLKHNNRF